VFHWRDHCRKAVLRGEAAVPALPERDRPSSFCPETAICLPRARRRLSANPAAGYQ